MADLAAPGPRRTRFFSRAVAFLGPTATVAAAILLLLLLIGLLEPFLGFEGVKAVASGPRRAPPSAEWLFGTDNLGRSLLARVIEGVRLTLLVSVAAVLAAGAAGAAIGLLAAWRRGLVDLAVARLADVLFAFPSIIFALIVSTILGPGTLSAIVAIFFIVLPTMIRVVRGAALGVVGRDFVVNARISGASAARVLVTHVLPNVAAVTVVQMAYLLSIGMLIESGLSFLGLGVQPPATSLGYLLREYAAFLSIAPWMVLIPGAVLTAAILSVNLLGDAARAAIEPARPRPLV